MSGSSEFSPAAHAVRNTRCTPLSLKTGGLSSPTCRRGRGKSTCVRRLCMGSATLLRSAQPALLTWSANAASSNAFCIWPGLHGRAGGWGRGAQNSKYTGKQEAEGCSRSGRSS